MSYNYVADIAGLSSLV